jgi:antitoxin YefM
MARLRGMTSSVPIAQAKAKLSELVDEVARTHDRVTVTRHGEPVAVLMSVDALEVLEDSLFWQDQPGIDDDIAIARAEAHAGELVGEDVVRRRYGARRRQ